jgi:hypothetical protein
MDRCLEKLLCADGKLGEVSSRLSQEVMVPLTSRAFMLGHLVHTNEILVLLGDNYFIGTCTTPVFMEYQVIATKDEEDDIWSHF